MQGAELVQWSLARRIPEEVPAEIAQLMYECLDYDPQKRPSAKQIYDRLAASTAAELAQQRQSLLSAQATAPGDAGAETAAAACDGLAPAPAAHVPVHGASATAMPQEETIPTPLGKAVLPIKSPFAN